MKKKLLKAMTSLLLAGTLLLSPGELPLSLNHSAYAAADIRIGDNTYSANTKILDLQNMGLTDKDIKNLGSFTNLEELIISDNNITDLSPVKKLTKLEKITFHNNSVSDISFVKKLKKLTVFGAINNPISDISALSGLTELKEVWMGDNPLTDISPLKNCDKLTHVSFNNCSLKNINALSGKKDLDTVCLENCGLKSIDPLKDCGKLSAVYLRDNKLTDLSALSKSYDRLVDLYADIEYAPSAESSALSAPTASKESGTIYCDSDSTLIKLSAQSGATIYYSLNGGKYKKYSSKIKLTKSSTVKAYAKKDGKTSETVTFKYTLTPSSDAIKFKTTDTAGGKLVKITSKISGLKIYYTTDGSTPTTKSKVYTSDGIKLTKTDKVSVLVKKSGWEKATITVGGSSGNSVSEEKNADPPAPVLASRTMPEDYSTKPVPFKTKIDKFNKQVKETPVPSEDQQAYKDYAGNGDFSVKKLEIDGIPLYEIKKKSSEPKPLVIMLHGGGGHKDLENAWFVSTSEEVCAVTIDCAGSGESQDGPLQAPAAFMETVKDIDTLIEYYNTVPDVDATNFGIMGHSMGGNIAMYYVLYGKYKPTAINVMNSSADLSKENPFWDCFDKGKNGQTPIWTEEQFRSFAEKTRPLNHPEYFKDIWVYACCGDQDDTHFPATIEKLKKEIEALGGKKFVYHLFKGVGHDTPQSWFDNEQKEFFAKLRS